MLGVITYWKVLRKNINTFHDTIAFHTTLENVNKLLMFTRVIEKDKSHEIG